MQIKHRLLIILMLFSATCLKCFSQSDRWIFYGLLLEENVGCTNPAHTQYAFKWIHESGELVNGKKAYVIAMDSFYNAFKMQYSNDSKVHINEYFEYNEGKQVKLAVVEKQRRCRNGKLIKTLSFYSGSTNEELKKNITTDINLFKNEIIGYSILREWDFLEEYKNLQKDDNVVEADDDFGGVKAHYKFFKKSSTKKGFLANFTNTTGNKIAIILVRVNDKMEVDYLKPGTTLTRTYNANEFDIQVQYQSNTRKKPTKSWVQFSREIIQKHLFGTENKIEKKVKLGSIGVRG